MCSYVADWSKEIRVRALGPIGLPVIPVGLIYLIEDSGQPPALFDVSLWFVPARGEGPFSFDPTRTQLVFSNGATAKPNVVQVSRFRTQLAYGPVNLFTSEKV